MVGSPKIKKKCRNYEFFNQNKLLFKGKNEELLYYIWTKMDSHIRTREKLSGRIVVSAWYRIMRLRLIQDALLCLMWKDLIQLVKFPLTSITDVKSERRERPCHPLHQSSCIELWLTWHIVIMNSPNEQTVKINQIVDLWWFAKTAKSLFLSTCTPFGT